MKQVKITTLTNPKLRTKPGTENYENPATQTT